MSLRPWWSVTLTCAVLLGCGATPVLTPRSEDASAPGDFYHSLVPAKSRCSKDVPTLEAAAVGGRAYHELSSISATCSPGARSVCLSSLRERACELNADAVILKNGESGSAPLGASNQSSITLDASAVTWDSAN